MRTFVVLTSHKRDLKTNEEFETPKTNDKNQKKVKNKYLFVFWLFIKDMKCQLQTRSAQISIEHFKLLLLFLFKMQKYRNKNTIEILKITYINMFQKISTNKT